MANLSHTNQKSRWTLPEDEGDHIVISGVAGRFPDSDNMDIFREKLKNKVDLISDDDRRWKLGRLHFESNIFRVQDCEIF